MQQAICLLFVRTQVRARVCACARACVRGCMHVLSAALCNLIMVYEIMTVCVTVSVRVCAPLLEQPIAVDTARLL